MRRGLPLREMVFLSKWYEDYLNKMYPQVPKDDDESPDEELIADAAWSAENIAGGKT